MEVWSPEAPGAEAKVNVTCEKHWCRSPRANGYPWRALVLPSRRAFWSPCCYTRHGIMHPLPQQLWRGAGGIPMADQRQCEIVCGVRSLSCASPGTASELTPETLKRCALRRFPRRRRYL
eukprot:15433018-Alexandrium_andersonii.AAC.1